MTENTVTLDAVRFTWQVNNATLETRRMTTPPVDGVPSTVTASAGTESVNRVPTATPSPATLTSTSTWSDRTATSAPALPETPLETANKKGPNRPTG